MPHPYPLPFIRQTKRHEGFSATVYPCPTGHPTIGYGTNLDVISVPGITADSVINEEQGERLMIAECIAKEEELLQRAAWTAELDEVRFHTLLNMAYNLGVVGLLGFKKALAAMQTSDWATAAAEMLDSKWARQVKGRSKDLADQIRTGKWCPKDV